MKFLIEADTKSAEKKQYNIEFGSKSAWKPLLSRRLNCDFYHQDDGYETLWQDVKIIAPRNARPEHPAKPGKGHRMPFKLLHNALNHQ